METVNKLKALLAKQDLSPIYTKMFVSRFVQDYDVFASVKGDEEEIEAEKRYYTYRGGGYFGCLYEVREEAYEEVQSLQSPDFFDYLSRGIGSYGMIQSADLVSYAFEEDDSKNLYSLQSLAFAQEVEARFTESTVQVVNDLHTREDLDGAYDGYGGQHFNGIIDKAKLFDAISVRAFSNIFARTSLFDGQRSCEALDNLYFDILKGLPSKSDNELSQFIASNNITIEEDEENTLVHFKVEDASLREALDENDIIPGEFTGTLTYEKESGKFDAFDYSIIYISNEIDPLTGNVSVATMEFKADGYSWNQSYGREIYIDPDPTVYEDAEEFLSDVVDEVIPPSF